MFSVGVLTLAENERPVRISICSMWSKSGLFVIVMCHKLSFILETIASQVGYSTDALLSDDSDKFSQ